MCLLPLATKYLVFDFWWLLNVSFPFSQCFWKCFGTALSQFKLSSHNLWSIISPGSINSATDPSGSCIPVSVDIMPFLVLGLSFMSILNVNTYSIFKAPPVLFLLAEINYWTCVLQLFLLSHADTVSSACLLFDENFVKLNPPDLYISFASFISCIASFSDFIDFSSSSK